MIDANEAARAYRQQAVLTASKEKLIVLLYDSCLGDLQRAHQLMNQPQHTGRVGEALGRAFSIVSELKTALDLEVGGEIAANLDGLYSFVQDSITSANARREIEFVQHATNVMSQLKEGWDGILCSA